MEAIQGLGMPLSPTAAGQPLPQRDASVFTTKVTPEGIYDVSEELYETMPDASQQDPGYEYVYFKPHISQPPKGDEAIYEDIPGDYTPSTPKLPPLPSNVPTATPSGVCSSRADDPVYYAIRDRTSSALNSHQIDHLISMLQSVQSTLAREDKSNNAEVGQTAGEIPQPPPTSPPPQDIETSLHTKSSRNDPDIYSTLPTPVSQVNPTPEVQPPQLPVLDVKSPLTRPERRQGFRQDLSKFLKLLE